MLKLIGKVNLSNIENIFDRKNYRFTGETRVNKEGITLYQIVATRNFSSVPRGKVGGWIEKKSNLKHNAWIDENSEIFGNALVGDNSYVKNSIISEDAVITGNSFIVNSRVENKALLSNVNITNSTIQSDDLFENDAIFDSHIVSLRHMTKPDDHYTFSGRIRKINGITLYQIKALKNFNVFNTTILDENSFLLPNQLSIKEGDIGGWIESERNLEQGSNCWIDSESEIFESARIKRNVLIIGSSLSGKVIISDNTLIKNSSISGELLISEKSIITNCRLHRQKTSEYRNKNLNNITDANHYEFTGDTKINSDGVTLYQIRAIKNIREDGIVFGDLGGWIEREENLEQGFGAWVYVDSEISGNSIVKDDAAVFGGSILKGDVVVRESSAIISSQLFGKFNVSGASVIRDSILCTKSGEHFIDLDITNENIISVDDNIKYFLELNTIDKDKFNDWIVKNLETLKNL